MRFFSYDWIMTRDNIVRDVETRRQNDGPSELHWTGEVPVNSVILLQPIETCGTKRVNRRSTNVQGVPF